MQVESIGVGFEKVVVGYVVSVCGGLGLAKQRNESLGMDDSFSKPRENMGASRAGDAGRRVSVCG